MNDVRVSPARWVYVVALAMYIIGAVDFLIYIVDEPESLAPALTGLYLWWSLASLIALAIYIKRRKAKLAR